MLELADHWVWDSWLFDDGQNFHIFFLRASRALLDSDRRHFRASIGHAISDDLTNWSLLPDALVADDLPAWDGVATWTGSVVKNPHDNLYYLFYTGVSQNERGCVQQIGCATSEDLISWNRSAHNPLVKADSDFYQTQENGATDTNWRDPWVFFDSRDGLWHMLITSDFLGGSKTSKGTVGHATSKDLQVWNVHPPLHGESGFGQLEVMQIEEIDGRHVGVFCVASIHLDQSDLTLKRFKTGTYSVPADSPTGPFHFDRADLIDADGIYAGRIIRDRAGDWVLLGFENGQVKSDFMGRICDPIPLELTEAGILKVKA